MAADFIFVTGKYWRILVILSTGMMGMVVTTGNRENDIKSIASVLNEIGVGLNIEVATDNKRYLKDLMAKRLTRSNMRSFHWRNISEYRPRLRVARGGQKPSSHPFGMIGFVKPVLPWKGHRMVLSLQPGVLLQRRSQNRSSAKSGAAGQASVDGGQVTVAGAC